VQPLRERLPRRQAGEVVRGAADRLDLVEVDGLEQVLARGEVAVQRADADLGAAGDVLERGGRAVLGEGVPEIEDTLGFSPTELSWVQNAYALTFGGLLLLGARAGDILGRRRVFVFGIGLFTFASMLGGLAQSPGWLLAARALQGVGAAIAAPSTLALLTTSFAEGPERTRAVALYSGVAGAGGSLGLVLGGALTSWVSWRWGLFINVPLGAALIWLAPRALPETERRPGRFDLAGALTSTAGMSAVVYGFVRAAADGWGDPLTLASFASGVALLVAFVLTERRAPQPITPLRLFASRERSGALVARMLVVSGMFSMFFFVTQLLQGVHGYSALHAGLAFLPMTLTMFATTASASATNTAELASAVPTAAASS